MTDVAPDRAILPRALPRALPRSMKAWPAFFDQLGANYDQLAFEGAGLAALSAQELSVVTGALGEGRGRSVLDVGAGTGRFSTRLAAAGWQITALDAAAEMLSVVKERVPGAVTVQGRLGERLPFDDGQFDALVAMRVIKYVRDTASVVRELARVVAPGGRLVFDLSNGHSLARLGYRAGTIGFVTPRRLAALLADAGLAQVAVHSGPRLPYPFHSKAKGSLTAGAVGTVEQGLDRVLPGVTGARVLIVDAIRGR